MSTILDALRKSKDAPMKDNVDAKREVLNGNSHNYLAGGTSGPVDQSRTLKIVIVVLCLVLLLLTGFVIYLVIDKSSRGDRGSDTQNRAGLYGGMRMQAPTPTPTPWTTPLPTASPTPTVTPSPTPTPRATPKLVRIDVMGDEENPVDLAPAKNTPQIRNNGTRASRNSSLRKINQFALSGIIWDSSDPVALVNGEAVHNGDRLNGATVKRINKNTVVLEIDGEDFVLAISGSNDNQ